MKISSSIRSLYDKQVDLNSLLSKRITELLGDGNKGRWFYKSRIKQPESFAQKLETGRFDPKALEDFFACTLVVENRSAIHEAETLVEEYFNIQYRKPKDVTKTHKVPELFCFDDLRLYVKLKPSEITPSLELNDITFEIQIKTFLQYAWSIATHGLVYKGDSISWSKARVAFQIKAMLENAEISIEQVDNIANSTGLALTDLKTEELKEIITWLKAKWDVELLPKDLVRLGETISNLLYTLRLGLNDLENAISNETAMGLGTKQKNLSPYEIIIKSLFNQHSKAITVYLNDHKNRNRTKIFVTPEMEVEDFLKNVPTHKLVFAKSI